jgi:hypothetical protein
MPAMLIGSIALHEVLVCKNCQLLRFSGSSRSGRGGRNAIPFEFRKKLVSASSVPVSDAVNAAD